jgi:hypothetical protein
MDGMPRGGAIIPQRLPPGPLSLCGKETLILRRETAFLAKEYQQGSAPFLEDYREDVGINENYAPYGW